MKRFDHTQGQRLCWHEDSGFVSALSLGFMITNPAMGIERKLYARRLWRPIRVSGGIRILEDRTVTADSNRQRAHNRQNGEIVDKICSRIPRGRSFLNQVGRLLFSPESRVPCN